MEPLHTWRSGHMVHDMAVFGRREDEVMDYDDMTALEHFYGEEEYYEK